MWFRDICLLRRPQKPIPQPLLAGLKPRHYKSNPTGLKRPATTGRAQARPLRRGPETDQRIRWHLMIDETRRAGGLLGRVGFVARLSACLAMAAVKAQGSIALFENPKPPQGAGFFGQVEVRSEERRVGKEYKCEGRVGADK